MFLPGEQGGSDRQQQTRNSHRYQSQISKTGKAKQDEHYRISADKGHQKLSRQQHIGGVRHIDHWVAGMNHDDKRSKNSEGNDDKAVDLE